MTGRMRAVASLLRELNDTHGHLTPEIVVNAAKNPKSIIHEYIFGKGDAAAAHEYRLDQARRLIRSVRYTEEVTQIEFRAPAYVSVQHDPGCSIYVSMDRVSSEKDLARQSFNDEITRCIAAIERARAVSDVLGMRDQVEVALRQMIEIRESLRAA